MNKSQYRFLIIDGFPTMRRIVCNLLKGLGFSNVDETEDGTAGLVKVREGRFDFVILDWSMPNMDGLQMLQSIHGGANPVISEISVLTVTAEAKKESIIAATQAGANGYMIKPFTAATLDEKLGKAFEKLEKGAQ